MPTIARKGCDEVGNLKSRDHGAHSLPNEVDKKQEQYTIGELGVQECFFG